MSTQTHNTHNTLEFPTIGLFRERIKLFGEESGKSLKQIATEAGLNYRSLVEICCREPGTNRTQKPEHMILLADRLNAIGVDVSREDLAEIILTYPSDLIAS